MASERVKMFTGIIEEVGTLDSLEARGAGSRLRVRAPLVASDCAEGDSVSVNGVCLTAVDVRNDSFCADASPETLKRSSLGSLRAGAPLNLERALKPTSRLGGHIVQGHVDATGELVSLELLGDNNWWLQLRIPPEIDRYVVFKGSLSIEGISLTVAAIEDRLVSVTIIPHTYSHTNLPSKKPGDALNLETDVLAKYVEKMLAGYLPGGSKPGLDLNRLLEEGY
jgi:riboflavin synthase